MKLFQIDHLNLIKPTAKEVTFLRKALQHHFCIKDAAAAKKLCANIAAVTPNLWRRWEQNSSQASEQAWLLTRMRVNLLLTEGSDFSTQMKPHIRAMQRSSSARPRPNALLDYPGSGYAAYNSVDFA